MAMMNTRSLWIAALSGAVLTTLFSNLPVIGVFNCVVCAWFWGGGLFAIWLYRRLSGGLPTMRQGLTIGALTGVLAGALGFTLSFVGFSGMQGLMNDSSGLLGPDASSGMQDMPAWAPIVFNLIGVVFNIVFGTVGGWLGVTLLNRNRPAAKQEAVL
jgi:hypothetical protein